MFNTVACILSALVLAGCGTKPQEKCTEADKKSIGEGKTESITEGCKKCLLTAAEELQKKCSNLCPGDIGECAKCVKNASDPLLRCL